MPLDTTVIEKKKTTSKKLKEPSKYKVIICNDNITPIEFVIDLLIYIFKYDQSKAIDLTLQIHETGNGIAGIFTYEIAEQKSIDSMTMARNHGYPLLTKIEEV